MKSLKFPNSDLSEMRQFYEEELEKTVKKLQHIKSVLEQLGGASPQIVINIEGETASPNAAVGPKKAGGKVKTKKPVKAAAKTGEKGKRGRKSTWEPLLLKRLEVLDKPVTYDELTDDVMQFSKLPKSKLKSTKQAVVNMVFRLRADGKKVDTFANGSREKYVALNAWFDKPGKINKDYLAKLPAKVAEPVKVVAKKAATKAKPKAKVAKKTVKATSTAVKTTAKKVVTKAPKTKTVAKSTLKKASAKKTAVKGKKTSVLKKAKSEAVKGSVVSPVAAPTKKVAKKKVAKKKVAKSTPVKAAGTQDTDKKVTAKTPVAKKSKGVKKVAVKKAAKTPAVKKKVTAKKKPVAKKATPKVAKAKEAPAVATPVTPEVK